MRKFLTLSCMLLCLLIAQVHAQERTISGQVTDAENDSGLPGVTVILQGTNNGTTTDFDGNYNITVPSGDAVLVFRFIGYQTEEITVGNRTRLDVALEPDVSQLEEVVVVGFGQKKKKDLTGSITTVGSEELAKITNASPQFALQGNTPGVRVVNTSGNPNDAPKIYVRGIGTWNGDAQPLFVIDGQIIEPPRAGNEDVIGAGGLNTPPNMFNLINPNDIESLTVLKDASAAAIYGSRGANGVVLITTKRGKLGAPSIEANARTSVQNYPTYDVLNTQQYRNLAHEMYANNLNPDVYIEKNLYGREEPSEVGQLSNFSPQFDPESRFYISDPTTYDWQNELVNKNAINQAYDVKISGATDRVNYYVSAGFFNQEGMIRGDELSRYTGALNVESDVTDWLKLGVLYKYSYQESEMNGRGSLTSLASTPPWQPIYDPNNEYGFAQPINPYGYSEEWRPARLYGAGTSDNYRALGALEHRDLLHTRQLGQLFVEVTPLEGLMLRGSLNLDYATQDRFAFDPWSVSNIFKAQGIDPRNENPAAPASLGRMQHRINNIFNFQSDFTAIYNRTIADKHSITLTAAVQDQRHRRENFDYRLLNLSRLNFDNPRMNTMSNNPANSDAFNGFDQRFWFGMVGRLSYVYDNKYYIDGSFRRDASNGFDDDYRWGNFYSLSGAWRISDEAFMRGLTFLDDLKIRGGWGQAGNDQAAVGRYAFLPTVNTGQSSYRFGSGNGDPVGTYYPGGLVNVFPNRELTWEVVTTNYIGFDAYLFRNRLSMSAEVYKRSTDGILQSVPLPLSMATVDPLFNIGQMENRGVDLQMGYQNRIGEFSFGISGNISFLHNEVTALYNNQPLTLGGGGQFAERADDARIEVGRSAGIIWGYQVGGIFQSQEEIDAYYANIDDEIVTNQDQVAPGDMYFLDVHGNPTDEEPYYSTSPDGRLNSFDQTEIGNTIPGYTYGMNLNASWKGFDLSMNFYGEGDVDRYNNVGRQFTAVSGVGNNYFTSVLGAWTPENPSSTIPRNVINDPSGSNRMSSRWVESAAFFRLNNWQFGYSLPGSLLGKVNAIQSLRLYIGGENNLYLHNWPVVDPVNDVYPLPRTMTAGLNIRL